MCGYDMIVACNAMLAKNAIPRFGWPYQSKLLGKKMQCHKGQLAGYDTTGGGMPLGCPIPNCLASTGKITKVKDIHATKT